MPSISIQPNRAYQNIPDVSDDPASQKVALQTIKDALQTHERRDNNYLKSFIRFEELVELGIIDASGEFVLDTGGSATTAALDDLTDVTIASLADNQILGYDFASSMWTSQSAGDLNLSVVGHTHPLPSLELDDLTDVNLTGAQDNDLLFRSGGNWVPTMGDLQWDGTDIRIPSGDILFYGPLDAVSQRIRQDSPASGDLTIDTPFGDLYIAAGVDLVMANSSPIVWSDAINIPIDMLVFENVVAGGSPPTDPDIGSVTLLMSFEGGVAGAEVYIPEIGPSMNWSIVSGTQPAQVDGEISTAQVKYGAKSIYYKEEAGIPNAGWASDAKQAGATYGFTGDFTLETDIFIVGNASAIELMALWDFGERQWNWSLEGGNGRMNFRLSTTGSNSLTPIAQHSWGGPAVGVPTGAWHHIALCRQGSNIYAWLDGVLSDLGAQVEAAAINIPTDAYFVVGQSGFQDGAGFVEAYMDNLRITDGVARYTAPFTPPTGPFDGTAGVETFIVGDPAFTTQVDGLAVNVTADLDVAGDITLSGTVDGRDVALDGVVQDAHIADTNIHFADAPNDGLNYIRNGLAWTELPPAVTGLGVWRYRTETTAPPNSGQIRFNNSDVSLATEFYLNETNDNGADVGTFLDLLATAGDVLYVQNVTDATSYLVVELGTFVDNGTYRTYQIANLLEGSGGEPSQNTKVTIVAAGSGSAAGGGGMVTGISLNSGADVNAANRSTLNFIEGANITLTITDDGAGDEVDITIAGASPTATNSNAIQMQFDSPTASGDPGNGRFRLNGSPLSSVSAFYIDALDDGGTNAEWAIGNLGQGDIITVRSTVDANDYAVYKVVDDSVDNTGWWTVGVVPVFVGTLFTNNDLCTIEFQWNNTSDGGISNVNIQNGNYTFVPSDTNKIVSKESGGVGETYTIPANTATGLPIGARIEINNDGGGNLSIAITTDTLTGTDGATGTRTLGTGHVAILRKVGATNWKYSASDL